MQTRNNSSQAKSSHQTSRYHPPHSPKSPSSQHHHEQLMRWATYASVGVASSLVLVKALGWWITGSSSILASLLDSAMDGLASLLNLFAVRYALTPPDNEHRFGHGKAEPIASLCQAIIIAASAILLAKHAFNAMTVPQVIEAPSLGAGIMIFSLFSTVGLLLFQRYVVRHTQSTAIQADALHYLGDLITQSAALVIMILAHWGWYGADPYIALAIGGYVFSSAWGIARDSFHILMDHELSSDTRARVERLVRAHPKVRGLHDMKTRRSGQTLFIQLHLELDDHISLIQAHHISDEVELSLLNAFPRAEVLIHQDPVSQYRRDPLPQDPSNP